MAFPTTGVLDDFNRADATSLGSNWSKGFSYADSQLLRILSNAAGYNAGDNSWCYYYWDIATFGPDCECYITVPSMDGDSDGVVVCVRIANPGDTHDGYGLYIDPGEATGNAAVSRFDDGVNTQLGASVTQAIDSGDRVGIEAIASAIKCYFSNEGGAFSEIISRTDATYGGAGYIQFYAGSDDATTRWDDFGGGTVVAAGGRQNVVHHMKQQRIS